jgi:hypothetical protein
MKSRYKKSGPSKMKGAARDRARRGVQCMGTKHTHVKKSKPIKMPLPFPQIF